MRSRSRRRGLSEPLGTGASQLVQEQEDRFAERGEHPAVHGPARRLLAQPAPGHPRPNPQRQLQRLKAAPFRGLISANVAKHLRGPVVGGAGVGDPLDELLDGVGYRLADGGPVGVILRARILRHPTLNRLDHFLGHRVQPGQHELHILRRHARPGSGAGLCHGLT